jgi:hypothetical protein
MAPRLPVELEREYGVFRNRILRGTFDLASRALARKDTLNKLRQDAEDEVSPDLEALLALLGISMVTLLNQDKLKQRLRTFAKRLSAQKQAELSQLLGKVVLPPSPRTLERWVEDQAKAITVSVETWLASANEQVAAGLREGQSIEQVRAALEKSANQAGLLGAAAASASILALNSQVVSEVAQEAGSTAYRWVTENDSRVRENHRPLHNTIQLWASPPEGGGTKPEDYGHPGSGWGCRCISVPLAGTQTIPISISMNIIKGL